LSLAAAPRWRRNRPDESGTGSPAGLQLRQLPEPPPHVLGLGQPLLGRVQRRLHSPVLDGRLARCEVHLVGVRDQGSGVSNRIAEKWRILMEIKSFQDLIFWQKAMDFVVEVYQVTEGFPKTEQFGLTFQLRRCSVSEPSNIAEGHGRQSTREFLHFLSIASG